MLLPTFRGRKVGRVRADARIKIVHREAIHNPVKERQEGFVQAATAVPEVTSTPAEVH